MPKVLSRLRPWVLAAGVALVAGAVRLPMLLERGPIDDEAVYMVVGNEIAAGGLPYVDALERKPPFLLWIYGGLSSAAGESNWIALHATAFVWTLATMAGLLVLGRRLFNTSTGLMAALLYAVYQPWGTWKNFAFNGEVMMNLPIVWAWVVALARGRGSTRPELAGAGALLAAAFLMKQPAAIAVVPLGVYLFLPAYRASRGYSFGDVGVQAGMLTIGFITPLLAVGVVLQHQSILREAVYWTILNHDVPHVFWQRGVVHTAAFVGACLPLVVGAVACLRDPERWTAKAAERTALTGLVIVSAIAVAESGRFYPHYYIQLALPLALVAAPSLLRPIRMSTSSSVGPYRRWLGVWLGATIVVFPLIGARGLRLSAETTEAGRYIASHSEREDRIFVWGLAARIYVDAGRRPATRYITTFPLTGIIFGPPLPGVDTRARIVPGAWQTFEKDCARHPPRFIVDVQDPDIPYPIADFPQLAQLIHQRYRRVTTAREGAIYERVQ